MSRRKHALPAPEAEVILGDAPTANGDGAGATRVEAEPDHASLSRIKEAQADVKERLLKYLASKEETKLLKDAHDAAVDHLMSVIDKETEVLPLFDGGR